MPVAIVWCFRVLHGCDSFLSIVVVVWVDGDGLIRCGVRRRCGRGDGGLTGVGAGALVTGSGGVGIHAHGHDDHLAAATVAEAQGLQGLLHADLAQPKADGLEQILPVDVHRGGITADDDAGHFHLGGLRLVLVRSRAGTACR